MPLRYTDLDELTQPYAHIVVSPHLDDAALSCGGAIARLAGDNEPVLVVNVCSGSPPPGTLFSPFAAANHARWGLAPGEVVQRRLREDDEALETLGADSYQLDRLDAIYRMPERYASEETLFGTVAPDDPLAEGLWAELAQLVALYPDAIVYAPLGVGAHVDHQLAYQAAVAVARAGTSVAFYEDFPYVAQPGALERRQAALGGPELFVPVVRDIDDTLARKILAIQAYASQLSTLFGSSDAVAGAVSAYAERLRPEQGTYGERVWVRR